MKVKLKIPHLLNILLLLILLFVSIVCVEGCRGEYYLMESPCASPPNSAFNPISSQLHVIWLWELEIGQSGNFELWKIKC